MALTHWAFIYTAPGLSAEGNTQVVESPQCRTVLVGVPSVDAGVNLAGRLVDDGAQLIELCGGFGPLGTARVLAAIGNRVPVGAVGYGPESVTGVYTIFGS
jgi:predicted polyphosphate/ATP-dependent NAD kinase